MNVSSFTDIINVLQLLGIIENREIEDISNFLKEYLVEEIITITKIKDKGEV